jgi:hypothetical protein
MRMFALVVLFAVAAQAQEDTGTNTENGVAYQRRTVINFDDDTIEGGLKTPDGALNEARTKMRHRSLIRIRTHFRREVLSSVGGL